MDVYVIDVASVYTHTRDFIFVYYEIGIFSPLLALEAKYHIFNK